MKILLLFFYMNLCFGEVIQYIEKDYDKALTNSSRIVFNMESTKAGIITTSFEGVVKDFSVDYILKNNNFKNIKLSMKAVSFDTDNDGRNEKMQELCLESGKFPNISISLSEDYKVGTNTELKGQITIKSISYPILVKLESETVDGRPVVKGSSSLSLKALAIPDPSIWIASVRDRVDIEFKLDLKSQE